MIRLDYDGILDGLPCTKPRYIGDKCTYYSLSYDQVLRWVKEGQQFKGYVHVTMGCTNDPVLGRPVYYMTAVTPYTSWVETGRGLSKLFSDENDINVPSGYLGYKHEAIYFDSLERYAQEHEAARATYRERFEWLITSCIRHRMPCQLRLN